MSSKLIKIGEASELLGVSIDTLRRWDKLGKFPSIRTGLRGHRFYKFSDVENKLNYATNYNSLAIEWVRSQNGFILNSQIYCEIFPGCEYLLSINKVEINKGVIKSVLVSFKDLDHLNLF